MNQKSSTKKTIKIRYKEYTCAVCGKHVYTDDSYYRQREPGKAWQYYHVECRPKGN